MKVMKSLLRTGGVVFNASPSSGVTLSYPARSRDHEADSLPRYLA